MQNNQNNVIVVDDPRWIPNKYMTPLKFPLDQNINAMVFQVTQDVNLKFKESNKIVKLEAGDYIATTRKVNGENKFVGFNTKDSDEKGVLPEGSSYVHKKYNYKKNNNNDKKNNNNDKKNNNDDKRYIFTDENNVITGIFPTQEPNAFRFMFNNVYNLNVTFEPYVKRIKNENTGKITLDHNPTDRMPGGYTYFIFNKNNTITHGLRNMSDARAEHLKKNLPTQDGLKEIFSYYIKSKTATPSIKILLPNSIFKEGGISNIITDRNGVLKEIIFSRPRTEVNINSQINNNHDDDDNQIEEENDDPLNTAFINDDPLNTAFINIDLEQIEDKHNDHSKLNPIFLKDIQLCLVDKNGKYFIDDNKQYKTISSLKTSEITSKPLSFIQINEKKNIISFGFSNNEYGDPQAVMSIIQCKINNDHLEIVNVCKEVNSTTWFDGDMVPAQDILCVNNTATKFVKDKTIFPMCKNIKEQDNNTKTKPMDNTEPKSTTKQINKDNTQSK